MKLTEKQKNIVKLIKVFYKKNGYPCSQVYLATACNIKPPSMADHIKALINKGVIRKTPDGKCYPHITR